MTHPITPPPELVRQWETDWHYSKVKHIGLELYIAAQAAQWGADQELEACLRHLDAKGHHPTVLDALRAARRPKPLSLKQQAVDAMHEIIDDRNTFSRHIETIRRALEALPE